MWVGVVDFIKENGYDWVCGDFLCMVGVVDKWRVCSVWGVWRVCMYGVSVYGVYVNVCYIRERKSLAFIII
jgi:hypothetical protein